MVDKSFNYTETLKKLQQDGAYSFMVLQNHWRKKADKKIKVHKRTIRSVGKKTQGDYHI